MELMSEKVYRQIRNMIAIHRFEPGFRLNVAKLSRELGVSRTPVWEAMRRLEQERVIKTIPNRGVFMATISFERILDLMEVRGLLDRFAGRLACKRANKRMIHRLAQCLPDQLLAIEKSDLSSYYLADNEFHRIIYEASGNSYLMELFESISLHMLPRPHPFHSMASWSRQTLSVYQMHKEVIEGLINRDPERVESALLRHTEIIISYVKEQMRATTQREKIVRSMGNLSVPSPMQLEKPRS